jgi:hypothetical protein
MIPERQTEKTEAAFLQKLRQFILGETSEKSMNFLSWAHLPLDIMVWMEASNPIGTW